jgi:hypothetical protein
VTYPQIAEITHRLKISGHKEAQKAQKGIADKRTQKALAFLGLLCLFVANSFSA